MTYVTGDVHGYFGRIGRFCAYAGTTRDDVVVVLGDACVNFWGDEADDALKRRIESLPVTVLCVHGNHEARPATVPGYEEAPWRGGTVYRQRRYPHVLFAKDGSVFDLDGLSCLVAGGAYSIDKDFRLRDGRRWFPDEQPGPVERANVERACERRGWRVDCVFSHTCPLERRPFDAFLARVRQREVDTSTEEWLSAIAARLTYRRWLHGHFHVDRRDDPRMWTLFRDVIELRSGRVRYTAAMDARVCAGLAPGEPDAPAPLPVAAGTAEPRPAVTTPVTLGPVTPRRRADAR